MIPQVPMNTRRPAREQGALVVEACEVSAKGYPDQTRTTLTWWLDAFRH